MTKKLKQFAVIDFEATKWTNYLCNGIYNGIDYEQFTDLSDFFDFLHDYKQTTIFAHFGGGYDFNFILEYILNHNDYRFDSLIPRGSRIFSLSIRSNQSNKLFKFYDSSALLPFSLKNISNAFNVETKKGEIDYEKMTLVTTEILEYMKDDHLALFQCLKTLFAWNLIKLHGWKTTLASQALHIFKKEFYKKKSLYQLPMYLDNFVRESYLGGRTEIFRMTYDNPNKSLNCYDVNSLYPTVMQCNDFPSEFIGYNTEFDSQSLGVYHLRIKSPDNLPIPILGCKFKVNKTESFIFPLGEFDGHWCTPEINYALENGYKIIKVYEGAIFENDGKIFKNFINYFYNKRKKSTNEVDNIICKLIMNSLYGRFGMNTIKEQIQMQQLDDDEKFFVEYNAKSGDKHTFCTIEEEINTYSNVTVASFVTAYARIHMHKELKKINYNAWYMDTDSIFTDEIIENGTNLGQMKLEYSVNKACFLLPKTYIAGEKVTMKGFPKKKIKNFKYRDFMTCLEGDLKIMNKLQKNPLSVTIDPQFNKFRSALKKGNLLSMSSPMIKKVSSKYDKRIVNKDYSTSPIRI